jgi:hypothetical protein
MQLLLLLLLLLLTYPSCPYLVSACLPLPLSSKKEELQRFPHTVRRCEPLMQRHADETVRDTQFLRLLRHSPNVHGTSASMMITDGPRLIAILLLLRQLTRYSIKARKQRQPSACFGARSSSSSSSSAATPLLLFAVTHSAAQCRDARRPSTEEHHVVPQLRPISHLSRSRLVLSILVLSCRISRRSVDCIIYFFLLLLIILIIITCTQRHSFLNFS